MTNLLLMLAGIFSLLFGRSSVQKDGIVVPKESFYALKFTSISGDTIDFSTLKGKKVLLVNTASKCGFTPQFEELEALSQKYKDKLVVIGFPSNDFGGQDPGSNKEIQEFCQLNYGVSFLMMEKSEVKGETKNAVFSWLSDKNKNGWNEKEPVWNFCKYLVDEKGNLRAFFTSKTKPSSEEVVRLIDETN